jgi:hypothetical protein
VEQAKEAVDKVTQEVFTFAKLLPTPKEADTRHKRESGLINVGGDVKFFVRGRNNPTIERFAYHGRISTAIYAVRKKLTYFKSIYEIITQNAVGLATVARIFKNVITNSFTYQKTFEDAVQNLKALIFFQSYVSRAMR